MPIDNQYDIIVIGAGSGGLTAAEFAARLGVRVALIEKNRVGGDCTWSGCVPSKALLKVAKVAQTIRTADQFGIEPGSQPPRVDMVAVRDYLKQVIDQVYRHETPAQLAARGIEVISGAATFLDPHTIQIGQQRLTAKKFIIATGAHPFLPPVSGLDRVEYLTYLQIFENERLPQRLLVIGAGPVGSELAQAYRRLGAQVTLIGTGLLPREEPEVAQVMSRVFAREGIRFVEGLVSQAKQIEDEVLVTVDETIYRGDMLLVAAGRAPVVDGLGLKQAGVDYSAKGIAVDQYLRTSAKHILAVGDCVRGNDQFTHLAGWQGFQASRNALLPLQAKGFLETTPRTTFTEPEVAQAGLTEAKAREKFGAAVQVRLQPLARVDRAVTENDTEGFIKLIYRKNGRILGATIVAKRAGEMITEYILTMQQGLKLIDLAQMMHVYPTYSMGNMRLAAQVSSDRLMNGWLGAVLRKLAGGR